MKRLLNLVLILAVSRCGTGVVRPASATAPSTPTSLFAAAISTSEIALSWIGVENESAYEIQVSTDGNSWSDLTTSVAADTATYSQSGLSNGDTRYYRIRAKNTFGASAYSTSVNATTTADHLLAYSTATFTEPTSPNDGTFSSVTVTIAVSNDSFAETLSSGTHYSISSGAVPTGLSLTVTRTTANLLTLSLSGTASSHRNSSDTSFTVDLETAAFTSATQPTGYSQVFNVDYVDVSTSKTKYPRSASGFTDATNDNAKTCNNSYALGQPWYSQPTLTVTDFFSTDPIPTNATIDGIIMSIEYKNGGGSSCKQHTVRLVKAGSQVGDNKADTSVSLSTTEATVAFGDSTAKWGTTWTDVSEINAAGFGGAFKTTNDNQGSTPGAASVDCISITVHYTY